MRILIVNAHSPIIENQKAFQDLLASVKEILKMRNGLLEMTDEYIVRSKDNLEDFLYDEFTSFNLMNPGKNFDALDFIIVSGDQHMLPWHPTNFKVVTLIRMCLRVKKCLFSIGFGMQALVYLSASNIDHPIHVINGKGKGSNLSEMSNLTLRPNQIKSDDYFLDNVTGDLYGFMHENNEWSPVCNVGLHQSRAAQQFATIGKFIIKTPIYRPKKNPKNQEMLDEYRETNCYVKKVHLKHWLMQKCSIDFKVPYDGRWEVHSFSFTNKEKSFDVLAESENGPLIVEMHRIVGVKFRINKKYPETFEIFKNFVMKYASDIMSSGKSQNMSILHYVDLSKANSKQIRFTAPKPEQIPVGARVSTRNGNNTPKYNLGNRLHTGNGATPTVSDQERMEVFKHSGMATKLKGKHIMQKNFISSNKIHYDSRPESPHRKKSHFLSPDEVLGKYTTGKNKTQTDFEYYPDAFDDYPGRPILKNSKTSLNKLQKALSGKSVSIGDGKPTAARNQGYLAQFMEDDFTLTRGEARKMLYPELPMNIEKNAWKVWVPGQLSAGHLKTPDIVSPKVIRVPTTECAYRKKGPLQKIEDNLEQKATIRSMGLYKTQEDLYREYQKKLDKKIIGPKLFKTSMDWSQSKSMAMSPTNDMDYRYYMGTMGMQRISEYQ